MLNSVHAKSRHYFGAMLRQAYSADTIAVAVTLKVTDNADA
jgi:hypothetical protein